MMIAGRVSEYSFQQAPPRTLASTSSPPLKPSTLTTTLHSSEKSTSLLNGINPFVEVLESLWVFCENTDSFYVCFVEFWEF